MSIPENINFVILGKFIEIFKEIFVDGQVTILTDKY